MTIGAKRAGEALWRDNAARPRVCPACLGTGLFGQDIEPSTYTTQCPTCEGVGRVRQDAYPMACERQRDQLAVERMRRENLRRAQRRSRGWLVPFACLTFVAVFTAGVIGGLQRLGLWPW